MRTFAQKQKTNHQTKSPSSKSQSQGFVTHNHPVRSILQLTAYNRESSLTAISTGKQ